MNSATRTALDMLIKVAEDNSTGAGFSGSEDSAPYRQLFEPAKGDTSISGLIETLDRKQLESEWQQVYKSEDKPAYDRMKLALQNDFVCQLHRDFQHRYSGRISRMLAETARKEGHAKKPDGLIALIESRINFFNQLQPGEE